MPVLQHVILDLSHNNSSLAERTPASRRSKIRANLRAAGRRAKAESNRRARAAVEGDSTGQWPVAGYINMREGESGIEVLVEWEGDHEPTWTHINNLTTDLRSEAKQEASYRFRPKIISRRARRLAIKGASVGRRLARADGTLTHNSRIADEVDSEVGSDVGSGVRFSRVAHDSVPRKTGSRRRVIDVVEGS